MAKPESTYWDCQDLQRQASSSTQSPSTSTPAAGDPGQAAFDACMRAGEKSNAECSLLLERNADDAEMLQSDTEGYYDQPKTCLEWKTNYSQRYVPWTMSNGASTWNGSSWVQTSPGTPGHFEQYPTGQTCVRYG